FVFVLSVLVRFFVHPPATPPIYTLSLHDALPISTWEALSASWARHTAIPAHAGGPPCGRIRTSHRGPVSTGTTARRSCRTSGSTIGGETAGGHTAST